MKKDSAISFQQELETLCEKNNAFCYVTHEKKPHLTGIKVEVSIKVDNDKKIDYESGQNVQLIRRSE